MTSMPYDDLSEKLVSYTEDEGPEFAANIPTIIQNGQERLVRDLNLEIFKGVAPGNFTINNNYLSKNPDILVLDEFYYKNSLNKWRLLLPRSYGFCIAYWPDLTATGDPRFYNEFNENQHFIVPTPAAAYSTTQRGLVRPSALDDDNQENWLTKHAGDLLFYAALVESEKFLMAINSGRVGEWKDEYLGRIPAAKEELRHMARIAYEPINRNAEVKQEGQQ